MKNTGTKPASFYEGIEYTWTDKDGNEKTSNLGEIATDPNQMIALLKEVYTNKNVPGNLHRGYNANGTATTGDVAYPAIGGIQRNYDSETRTYTHDFYDAYGWGMNHDEDNYPMTQQSVPSTTYTITDYIMNPNEYKPNQEGVTLLLVEMNDGVQYNSWSTRPGNYGQLRNLFEKMFKSVRVVTNSKLVEKKGEGNSTIPGTLFKVDCDKMNRFFFLAKGRLRHYAGQTGSSAYFRDQVKNSGSGSSYTWYDQENTQATVNPFNVMYEQFSPVSLSSSQESSDVYQSLINMDSYLVEHDCESVPWASANGVNGHEFNMYGKTSTSEDCQDVRDLMFFVPTKRMQAWSDRDRSTSDMYVNYYKPNAPTMGLYVIRQNPITGEQINGQNTYKLHLTWDSNLTDFVPSSEGAYFIYLVNEDGSYTKVGETNSQTKELYIDVNMAEHGQQVTYVIQGQDNTQFLSLQMSNEESFIIPGTDQYEKFQLLPNAEYYSRFNPADQYNYYANGLQIKNYPAGLNTTDLAGKKLIYYRQAKDQSVWDKVGEVTISGTTGSAEMFGQRAQSDYKYGYKTNPELVVSTSGSDYVFGTNEKPFIIFDNIKADVSLNIHADYYKYIVVVDGTPDQKDKIHSNAITIRVQKTAMSPIAGVFSKEAVDADTKHATGLVDKSFDVDVTYSSKTDVLRYDAYRWKDSEAIEIIDHTSDPDNEQDLAPQGIAGNQGEFYTVAMNSDYVGEDVYVTQGQTAQATFVDNVATDKAGAYTYAPVVETFTGRGDYNTYGAPLQHSATGTIGVKVQNISRNDKSGMIEQSTYTWPTGNPQYAYYNVYLNVDEINIPEGYDLYKVRAWRKIDPSLLAEELPAYQERMGNGDGECLFEEITSGTDAACKKTGITSYALGSVEKEDVSPVSGKPFKVWGGTFGAKILSQGDEMPMEFTVRAYFTRNANLTSGSSNAPRRAEGDATVTDANGYYITESTVKFTATGSDIITAVTDKSINREVKDVIYYNMTGAVSVRPFDGVNVVVTRYTDGTTSTRKMIK
ncbi:MAG: hypothetical protein J6I72_05020 [Muribaculaceae bacterium]|nr:hypothetical protein [Muribaculaceae bacterium]